MLPEENGLGWQTEEQWQALQDALIEFGAIAEPVDVNAAFCDESSSFDIQGRQAPVAIAMLAEGRLDEAKR